MKQEHQPPNGSPAERLDRAFRNVLNVSKADLLKEETRMKRAKERKKRSKKTG
jgi:hypothetical protein